MIGLKNFYFPLIQLTSCYRTVCCRKMSLTVPLANHIQSFNRNNIQTAVTNMTKQFLLKKWPKNKSFYVQSCSSIQPISISERHQRDIVSFRTQVFWLWKEFTPTWNQNTSRNVLQSSKCFASFSIVYWKTCFYACFCSSYKVVCIIFA